MKHTIEITTVEAMLMIQSLRYFCSLPERHRADVHMGIELQARIEDVIRHDLPKGEVEEDED